MPVARFQMPDGRIGRFEVPEGTTPEQAQQMIESHLSAQQPAPQAATQPKTRGLPPSEQPGMLESLGMGAAYGLGRSVLGAQQLLGKGLEAAGAEQAGRWLQEDVARGRERLAREIAPYKEAAPIATGVAEFGGEMMLPAGVISKGAQAIRAAGAIAPRMAGVTAPLAESLATGGFRTGLQPGTANVLAKLAGGAGAGATTSAILSGGDIGETAMGGGVGAAVPIVLPALGKLGYKGAEKLVDLATGMTPKVKAGKIAREAAGENLEAIKNALAQTAEGETAGQAAAYVQQPSFQALAELAERKDISGETFRKLSAQQIARQKQLAEVSPLLSEAEATRAAVTGPMYKRAFASDVQRMEDAARMAQMKTQQESGGLFPGQLGRAEVVPQLQAMKDNPVLKDAAKVAKDLANSQGVDIGNPMASLQGLHYMKLAIDSQFKNRTAATALQKYQEGALQNTKQRLLQAIEGTETEIGLSPAYGLARQKYAELSQPVNQAMILDKLQEILRAPGGVGEKESAFLNVLGAGENALIKKAGGQPRFGGLREALTPEQMSAFEDVVAQLQINKLASEQLPAGRQALADILAAQKQFRFPWMFGGRATQAANIALDEIADRVGKKTMNALVEGMRSGKSANELLNTLPASERDNLLRAMIESGRKTQGLGLTTGAAQSQVSREQ